MKKKLLLFLLLILLSKISIYSQMNIDSLRKLSNESSITAEEKFQLNYKIGKYYGNVNYDSSYYYFHSARDIAEKNKLMLLTAKINAALAHTDLATQQSDSALYHIKKSRKIYSDSNKIYLLAFLDAKEAFLYAHQFNYAKAYKLYRRALNRYTPQIKKVLFTNEPDNYIGDIKQAISIYLSISTDFGLFLLFHLEKYDEASSVFLNILEIANKYDMIMYQIASNTNLALIDQQLSKYDDGIVKALNSYALADKIGHTLYLLKTAQVLSDFYSLTKQFDNALLYAYKGLNESVKLGNKDEIMSSKYQVAKTQMALNNFDSVKVFISDINKFSIATNSNHIKQYLYKLQYLYHFYNKNMDSIFFYVQKVEGIQESLNKQTSKDELNKLETIYKVNSQKTALIKSELELKSKNKFLLFSLILSSLLFVFIIFYFYKNRKISKLNRRLNELDNKKNKLFSIIAHDLRSPIATNLQTWDLFSQMYNTIDRVALDQLVSVNYQSAITLQRFLDNLLNWSQNEIGHIKFEPKACNLYEIIEDLKPITEEIANKKEISIHIDIKKSIILKCDRHQIFTVLLNIIMNAIKFTNIKGNINIYSKQIKQLEYIYIEDTGIGMSKEIANNLFDIKAHNTVLGTNNEKGTGLGLLIANDFINNHKSKIQVESEIDKGTTFSFFLERL